MALNSQQLAMEIVAKDLATATLQRVNANVEQFTQTAARAQHGTVKLGEGLNKAANALTGLAGDAIGATGKIGKLAEGLLTFAVGGPVVTALAAGVLAIAAGYAKLTEGAREAQKATDDLITSLNIAADKRAGIDVLRQIAQARLEVAKLEQQLAQRSNPFSDALGLNDDLRQRLAAAKRAFYELATQVAATTGTMTDLVVESKKVKPLDLTAYGGGRPTTLKGPGLEPLKLKEAFPPGELDRIAGEFPPFTANVTDATTKLQYLAGAMEDVATATTGIGEGLMGLGDVVGGRFGDTARKIIAPFAKIEGTYFIIKGLAKIADSLFPPNPAGLASGSGMIARGRQLVALAGSGASFGGATGGAGGGGGIDRGQQAIAQQRGEVRVELKKGLVLTTDPDFQDFLVETLRGAGNRRVTVAYV